MNNNYNNFNNCYSEEENQQKNIETELIDATNNLIKEIDFSELEVMFEDSGFDYSLFGGKTIKEFLVSIVSGETDLSINTIFSYLLANIKNFFKSLVTPLLAVFLIILLAVLFNNLRGRKISGVSEIVYLVCFSAVIIILSACVKDLAVMVKDSINIMQEQTNIIFPILLVLMTTAGGTVSAGLYSPIIAFLSLIVSKVFVYILLPLFTLSLVLSIVGNISKNTSLDKLNLFLRSSFKWILGVVCAVFMAYLSVKSVVGAGKDGLTIKATKYAIKNYVPMLGGYISDGFEVVKAGGLIVKNAVGFVGIILLFSTCIMPIISIALTQLGLKFLAGVVEPVGDKKSANFLYSLSDSLKLLSAIIIGVAVMYFFTMYLMICSLSGVV